MSEGLIKRVSRIISASANSVVDSIENATPQLVMEQAIREIDVAIGDLRNQLGKAEGAKYLSHKTHESEKEKHTQLQQQIQVALESSRDDLAEAAIEKQMDIEAQLPILARSLQDAEGEITELNSYIAALQAKKREMAQQRRDFIIATEQAEQSLMAAGTPTGDTADKVEQASAAFDRIMNDNGVISSHSQFDSRKLAELEQLTRNNRIKERLAEAKSKADA